MTQNNNRKNGKSLEEQADELQHELRVVRARQRGDKRVLEEREADIIQQLETVQEKLKAAQWDETEEELI